MFDFSYRRPKLNIHDPPVKYFVFDYTSVAIHKLFRASNKHARCTVNKGMIDNPGIPLKAIS